MKKILFFLFILAAAKTFSQPYSIGHRQITWIDSLRSNRSVTFEVYYPATANADNVAVINNGKKFPLVVFGHGYQLTYTSYIWLKDSLVPKGYFLVFPRTEEKLFPNHTNFAKDYAFIIDKFDVTKKDKTNWYYLRIKNRYAVSGHSMGGGASLLSVQYSNKISAVFNFAAAETNPSAIAACRGIAIPSLIFAGGQDCVAPPSSNQQPMYDNIQNICKAYIQIDAAKHCQWANNNGVCRAGEFFCSAATAPPKVTLEKTFNLLYPWLNNKLYFNESEGQRFQTLLSSTSGISHQQSCGAANIADNKENNINLNRIKIYPSIAEKGATINITVSGLQHISRLKIFNQSGETAVTKNITQFNNQTIQIASADMQKGIYFVAVTDGKQQYKTSFIIK